MKKLLLLVAVLCLQSNLMDLNAQTKKAKSGVKNNKVAVQQVKSDLQAKPVEMKNQIDSIAYSLGLAQTQGLKNYLINKMEMDTTFMNDFIKGLNEGTKKLDKKENAHLAGIQIGQQIKNQMIKGINKELFGADSTKTINVDNFMAGFIAGTLEKGQKMTLQQAQEYAQKNMEALKNNSLEKTYGANKVAGAKFMAENKLKEGVITTPSGLQYKIVTAGTGEVPKAESKVKVHYKGTMLDGTEFDSSYKRNEPATFEAGQVIKGWTEALTMMPVGSKWILYIPQELAYGSREAGPIKPFSTLVFEVELLSIEK